MKGQSKIFVFFRIEKSVSNDFGDLGLIWIRPGPRPVIDIYSNYSVITYSTK